MNCDVMPKNLSVLLCCHSADDVESFEIAVTSTIINQILLPNELVVVFDGAGCETHIQALDTLKNHSDVSVIVVKNDQNLGLTRALNIGLQQCSGQYVARMDADDICLPNRFFKQLKFLESNKNIAFVGSSIIEFLDKNDHTLRTYPKDTETMIKSISYKCPIAHPSVMFNREVLGKALRYDQRYRTTQDLALWYQLLSKGFHGANITEPLLRYRINENFINRRSRNKAFNELKISLRGENELRGLNLHMLFPIFKFGVRLMPKLLLKWLYSSSFKRALDKVAL